MTTKIQQYFNNIAKCYDDNNIREVSILITIIRCIDIDRYVNTYIDPSLVNKSKPVFRQYFRFLTVVASLSDKKCTKFYHYMYCTYEELLHELNM